MIASRRGRAALAAERARLLRRRPAGRPAPRAALAAERARLPRRRPAGRPAPRAALAAERGQAAVETVAVAVALLVAGLSAFQLLAVGYAGSLAGGAAEAGALALAAGGDPAQAARLALPGWSRGRVSVSSTRERVRVALRPPAALPGLDRALAVEAEAAVDLP